MIGFKKITLLSAIFGMAVISSVSNAAGFPENVVYHVNDSANAVAAMNNINNHLGANPQAKIVLVTHGKGIDFLLKDEFDANDFAGKVAKLKAKGVTFNVCNNTLVGRKIDPKTVFSDAVIVPSGVAEITKLQTQEKYSYIKP